VHQLELLDELGRVVAIICQREIDHHRERFGEGPRSGLQSSLRETQSRAAEQGDVLFRDQCVRTLIELPEVGSGLHGAANCRDAGLLAHALDQRVDALVDGIAPVVQEAWLEGLEQRELPLREALGECGDDGVLVRVVVVERSDVDARARGDPVGRQRVDAGLVEQGCGGIQDPLDGRLRSRLHGSLSRR
jgi:hypothetical protein